MKTVIDFLTDRKTFYIVGQIFIILGLTLTCGQILREQQKKPRTYLNIILNRLRYIHYVGEWNFIKNFFRQDRLEDHPTNAPYSWLVENKFFIASPIFIFATLAVIYDKISDISTGVIYLRSPNYFISSPIVSVSTYYIIAFLIYESRFWKRKYLDGQRELGRIIDSHNKINEDVL